MEIEVWIDGTDYSADLNFPRTRIEQASDGTVSTATVSINIFNSVGATYGSAIYGVSPYGSGYSPNFALKEIIIQEAGASPANVLFAGEVVRASKTTKRYQFDEWVLECQGFEALLDQQNITETWANKSNRYIIQDAFAAEAPDIAVADATIDVIESNLYVDAAGWTLRELLDRLASICGARWFLSADKALYFARETSSTPPAAPFDIDVEYPDNATTYSCQLTRGTLDYSKIANYVTVQGGYTSGGSRATALSQDATSQSTYGVRKRVIADDGLTSTALCQARADAEVLEWKDPQAYGSFVVRIDGLAVGQKINIEARALGLSGDYIIKRIALQWETPTRTVYQVEYGSYDVRLDTLLRKLSRASSGKKGAILALPPEDSVDTLHIKDVAISTAKIANLAVTTAKMDNLAVTEAKIANLAVTNAKINDLAVSKLTAGSATFASVTQFGYGGNKLTLESGYLRIESASTRYVNVGSSQIDITNGGYQVSVTGSQVALTTDSLSGSSAVLTATGLTLKGTSAGAQAVLTSASLTFTAGTANTVVSAAGVQIYGGSTGIGIGNAVYANSQVQISSTRVDIRFSSTFNISVNQSTSAIVLQANSNTAITLATNVTIQSTASPLTIFGEVLVSPTFGGTGHLKLSASSQEIHIGGNMVVGSRKTLPSSPSADVASLKTCVDDIRQILYDHGLAR